MQCNYDYFGLVEPAHIYLCKTDNSIICELNGIDYTSVSYTKQINNFDTLQFDVHKYVDGEVSNGYEMLDEAMYLFLDGIGYFRVLYPEVQNDGFDEYKSVSAQSCDCELALKTLKNFKINTGETDSQEYLVNSNVKETDEGVKIAIKHVTLYDTKNPELSLLHLALRKISGWTIGQVDKAIIMTDVEEYEVDDDGNVTIKKNTIPSKRSFDIDSKNIYAFLTQDVSKKFECIFEFDIMNRKIHVHNVKKYGQDSNVFISYRNLIQTLNYAPAQEDNIMTRFDVRGGDDLTIDAVNFGTSTIENLSYYLNTKHVSKQLIDKYNHWLKDVEENRKLYMGYNRRYSILMEKRDEVNMRVPNDGLNTSWKQFSIKELGKIKEKYTIYMDALKSVELGYWDETNKKWLNKGAEQDYIAYQGILEIIDKTIEYKKASVTDDKTKSDELDDTIDGWKTKWELYGLTELKNKEKVYLQNIEVLQKYAKEWNDLNEKDKAEKHLSEENYNISHNQYLKYMKWEYGTDENGNIYTEAGHGGCSGAIVKRQGEYDVYQKQMDVLSKKMVSIGEINDKSLYSYIDESTKETIKFTNDELNTLSKLYNDTDYTNENILTISTNTAAEIINTQYQLLDDAMTELSKVCQPQLSFTLTMDNIFAIPGFKEWQGNFDIGNFIRLSFDENEYYSLKLRISSLTFNPCIIENDFQIEFTNMINYNGGRDDFAILLDSTVNTAKDQITGTVKSKLDTSGIEVSDALIRAMVSSTNLTNAITSNVFDYISANKGTFNELLAKTINVQDLMANSGMFQTIEVSKGVFKSVLLLDLSADRISVGTLSVDRLIIRGGTNSLMYTFNDTLGKLDITQISESEYNQYFMNGKNLAAHTVTADEILAKTITSTEITTDNLRGRNGWINLRYGTFSFYGSPENVTQNLENTLTVFANYVTENNLTDAQKTIFKAIDYDLDFSVDDVIGLNQDKIIEKISKMQKYTDDENLPGTLKASYTSLISELENYKLWLDLNDRIDSGKSASDFADMSDDELITEFGADNSNLSILRHYIDIKSSTDSGLLSWDGLNLTVKGKVCATSGNIGNLILSNGALHTENHNTYDADSDGIFLDKSIIAIGPQATVWFKNNGTGKIGTWTIASDAITKGNGFKGSAIGDAYFGNSGLSITDKFVVNNDGSFSATNATIKGAIEATSGSFTGELKSATGSFTGTVTAKELTAIEKGNIAGWTISKAALYKGNGYNISGGSYFGDSGLSISDKFIVDSNGYATINGSIFATSGSIGSVDIYSGGLGMGGELTGDRGMVYKCGVSATSSHAFWAGNEAFYVNMDGSMHCSSADIQGSITSTGGKISSINGTQRVTLMNGQLILSNGDPSNISAHRLFLGLDNDGNDAWLQIYDKTGYSMNPPVEISSGGIVCNSLICTTNKLKCYSIKNMEPNTPVISSINEKYYTSVIRTEKDGIRVYGNCGDASNTSDTSTNLSIPGTTSDRRLKTNISNTTVNNALEQILKINHRKFDWKRNKSHVDLGYIAQELEEINPNMVMIPDDPDDNYAVNTFYLTSLITKSIQEMYAELKAENAELKQQINDLKSQIN